MYPPEQILPPHNLSLFSSNTSEPNFNSSSRFEELDHQLAFYFPNSPYSSLQYNEDYIFNELTWEQLQQPFPSLTEQSAMQNPCQAPNLKQDAALPMPRNNVEKKRPTKKDRHSKITTAKGPRDRRMRLSLDVARKFFDLQDVLGYDKPSKTVEWLLIQANSAIDEISQGYTALATTAASVSSTQSECEVVSGIEDASATTATAAVKGGKKPEKKAKVVSAKRSRESRKEARERARTRTLARKTGADLKQCLEGGCWGGQFCGSVEESLGIKDVEDQRRNYGGGDDISVITRNWNPCCIYQQQDAAPQISHVNNELPEFEYCGKAWDYNNI